MSAVAYWWVPVLVAVIGIVPGLLAWHAARGVRTEVTTNHGKRLGEYIELIAEKVDLVDTKQDTQHAALGSKIDDVARRLDRHLQESEAERARHAAAVSAVLGRRRQRR